MGILDKFRGNPLEKFSLRELQEEEIRLRNKLNRDQKYVSQLEKKKKQLFQEGVGADFLKKKMIAQELKSLDLEQKLKVKFFISDQNRYRFIKNLIILKRFQRELEKHGVWKKLTSIDPEVLEGELIKLDLDGKAFDQILEDLNRVFEAGIAETSLEEDPVEKELMEAWAKVESGEEPEKVFEEVKEKIHKEEES